MFQNIDETPITSNKCKMSFEDSAQSAWIFVGGSNLLKALLDIKSSFGEKCGNPLAQILLLRVNTSKTVRIFIKTAVSVHADWNW